jgi:hypothetical protein
MPFNDQIRFWNWLRPWARRRAERARFEAALERLAGRDVADTIAEEDVRLLVATLEAGAQQTAAEKRAAVEEAGRPRN